MLKQPEPIERYTFGAYIKRGGRTVLDIEVEAIDTPESIRRAMSTVRRAMNSHVPDVAPITISAKETRTEHTAAPEFDAETEQAPAAQESTAAPTVSGQEPGPQPAAVPAPATKPDKPLEGVRGALHLRCEGCGKTLATFLKMKQREITCRCGHITDLTRPLARFQYTCPYCEMQRWGWTNLEDANISIKCKCGGMVDLQWVYKAKEYRN